MIRIRHDLLARTIIVGFYGLVTKTERGTDWLSSPLGSI
jgi:hypothetical protein